MPRTVAPLDLHPVASSVPARAARPVARRDRGSVTAETAVVPPVLLVVLAAAIGVLVWVSAQLARVDAARAAARAAARGDAPSSVQATGQRLAPAGASVSVSDDGRTVQVVVAASVRPFGRALRLPAVQVDGRAVASVEAAAVRDAP